MGKASDSRRGGKAAGSRRRVDEEAKASFVAALRESAPRDEAAKAAGFSSEAFYYARRRDAVFRLAWIWALELAAADHRAARSAASLWAGDGPGGIEIAANNRRRLQARRVRSARFTDKRKQVFLDHFGATADWFAASEAAGVHWSTAYRHRSRDGEFAALCAQALRQAYAFLEEEAVRRRLEAQRRLRAAPGPRGRPGQAPSAGAEAAEALEFERVLKLLARHERRDGGIGMREVSASGERRWTFDEAIALLDRKLRALGARSGVAADPVPLPAPEPGEGATPDPDHFP